MERRDPDRLQGKHYQTRRPSSLAISFPNDSTSLAEVLSSEPEAESAPASPAMSKLRRTSQFFTQWAPSFVKSSSSKLSDSPISPIHLPRGDIDSGCNSPTFERPPDLRKERLTSGRAGNFFSDTPSQHTISNCEADHRSSSPTESIISALRSFQQLQPETEPVSDFDTLRDAFQNFHVKSKNKSEGSEGETDSEKQLSESQKESDISSSSLELSPTSNPSDATAYDPLAKETFLQSPLLPDVCASRLFENDPQILPPTEIAAYLGQRGEESSKILEAYMGHFDFSKLRLDEAFRKLCTHLYLQAETQVIDRILAAFAHRYWSNNPDTIFKTQDVVYAVAYSLLLLNTDLHIAQNHSKMSRGSFIRNTLAVATAHDVDEPQDLDSGEPPRPSDDDLIAALKELYAAIKHNPILQLSEPAESSPHLKANDKPKLKQSKSSSRLHSVKNFGKAQLSWEKRSSSLNSPAPRPSSEPTDLISELFSNPPLPPTHQNLVNPTEAAVYPYTKMGLLVRKHLFERADKKAPQRAWRECLVVVGQGAIRMFKVDRGSRLPDPYGAPPVPIDPGLPQGEVRLRHSLAVSLPPPGYSSARPHVFALQLPSGGVYLFQAAAADQVAAWVVVCNFWAARESKAPLAGGISNIDYGWGSDNAEKPPEPEEDFDMPDSDPSQPVSSLQLFNSAPSSPPTPNISEWHPPSLPMTDSQLSEEEQLQSLRTQIVSLDTELVVHMERREAIQRRLPPRSAPYALAFSNWERQSQYLLRELIKYQTYEDILKRTLFADDSDPPPPAPVDGAPLPTSPPPSNLTA